MDLRFQQLQIFSRIPMLKNSLLFNNDFLYKYQLIISDILFQKHVISNSYINFKNYIKFVVIIYKMIDEEKPDDNEVFEEDEVVWAKIKGYPWWPAYINDVHEENEDQEIQYTVFFFGDNTHSRLGHSKIKKFIDKYTEFYPKSKVNRNLKLSLKKAQEKLAQNGENISVYETLRNSIQGKSKRGRKTCKTDSKKDSSEGNPLQTPQLNKSRTYQHRIQNRIQLESQHHSNPVRPIQQQSGNDQIEGEQSSQPPQQKVSPRKRGRKRKNPNFTPPKISSSKRITRKSKGSKQLPNKKKLQQVFNDQSSQQEQSEKENQSESPPKIQKTVRKRNVSRGRKNISSSSQEESSSSQQLPRQQPKPKGRPKLNKQKQKPIIPPQNIQQSSGVLSPQNQAIIERIQFSLNNREQLIETLLKIPINITNVKEILDLKVTDILRNGQITHNVRHLLESLKSILLYKYFPHDGKIKKKYEKTFKKKATQRNQDDNASNLIQNNATHLQIRRKTILKLESIIKSQVGDNSKDMATKIESYFRIRDPTIGDIYRQFAYKILRSLKDKVQSAQNVIDKLENQQYE